MAEPKKKKNLLETAADVVTNSPIAQVLTAPAKLAQEAIKIPEKAKQAVANTNVARDITQTPEGQNLLQKQNTPIVKPEPMYDISTLAGRFASLGVAPFQPGMTSQTSLGIQKQYAGETNPEAVEKLRQQFEGSEFGKQITEMKPQVEQRPEGFFANAINSFKLGSDVVSDVTTKIRKVLPKQLNKYISGGGAKGDFDDGVEALKVQIELLKSGNPNISTTAILDNLQRMTNSVSELERKEKFYSINNELYWITEGKNMEQDIIAYNQILNSMRYEVISALASTARQQGTQEVLGGQNL